MQAVMAGVPRLEFRTVVFTEGELERWRRDPFQFLRGLRASRFIERALGRKLKRRRGGSALFRRGVCRWP
jgi:hypothetical protein